MIKKFKEYKDSILIVVDVQKSFSKYFTDNYLKELMNYCKQFSKVYQVFDNHVDGHYVDKDYLYDDDHKVDDHHDLYDFPNQVGVIEKRYNYDVNVDFYKKILSSETYKLAKGKEKNNELKRGDYFNTTEGTIIVYIGNNHRWYHLPKKLYDLFLTLKGKDVVLTGGADGECLLDISISAKSLGVKVIENDKYIYSANNCPIK